MSERLRLRAPFSQSSQPRSSLQAQSREFIPSIFAYRPCYKPSRILYALLMHVRTPSQAAATPHLGGYLAVGLFAFTLISFVVESQLTQYVQTNLGYRQPFFLFYLVHSSFAIIFPCHLIYLLATTDHTAASLFRNLAFTISRHLDPRQKGTDPVFPRYRFARLILCMTLGITCPALLWFVAVSLASVSDVTAIWNTNAFFAYLLTVKLFNLKWEARRLLAVVLATLGTVAVVYGSASEESGNTHTDAPANATGIHLSLKPTAPLVGNLLTLVASFGYGLYQVLYKIYAALPSDPELAAELQYEAIPDDVEESGGETSFGAHAADADAQLPFGLHPNLLTSLLGLATLLILWIPIPFLHWSGAEVFRLPPDFHTVLSITGIALSGVVFNSGFMVLLGIWGPIIVSVGNLLTIVLVLISDVIIGGGTDVLTFWSMLGSGIIVLAFGVLAYDMFNKK
ncbi:hypothetical protein D9619_003283 [Psilocybe cf. subviscida]|uniref:EamA domain-containing protein n=1 Tax=Psilocybe cf. subviscida TaxID=2480587 RepID=A0A8H5AZB4_9AGAR|nr:hypothetical protein D9619_003283 [Psilocybe cf. subviscida]